METIAARILSAVLTAIKQQQHEAAFAALQDAEELGGPEGDDYVALMEAVRDAAAPAGMQALAEDAATRITVYKESDGYRQALQRAREIAAQAAAQMRPTWILLPDQRVPAPCLHTLSVLADYNGPQIVVAQGPDGALYLGVASDETPGLVRWLYAPITEAELRSLHAGELSLRAALVKPRTYVVDADREEMPVAAWLCDATTLHESDLPQPAALLPGHAPVVA